MHSIHLEKLRLSLPTLSCFVSLVKVCFSFFVVNDSDDRKCRVY